MSKRKIAVIGLKGLPAFGGAAKCGESLIDRLKDTYDFTVYAVSSHAQLHGTHTGFEQIVFKSARNNKVNIILYYLKSAFHCLLKGQYDLVHLNHGSSGFILPLLKMRYRTISTLHGSGENMQIYDKLGLLGKKLYFFTEFLILKLSDIVTSVSLPHVKYYQERANREIYYTPNGIDVRESGGQHDLRHADYVLFAAGRILQIKGCHLFLQALKKIGYKDKILIIGDLNQNPSYTKEVRNLSKGLDVEFIELIKDKFLLMSYLKNARLFVFPSLIEAMSNMLLEAVSARRPVICSDIPENAAIFNSEEMLYFESGNVEDLAKKIEWALSNQNEMSNMAEKAYRNLVKNYDWDEIASQYDQLYRKLIVESAN